MCLLRFVYRAGCSQGLAPVSAMMSGNEAARISLFSRSRCSPLRDIGSSCSECSVFRTRSELTAGHECAVVWASSEDPVRTIRYRSARTRVTRRISCILHQAARVPTFLTPVYLERESTHNGIALAVITRLLFPQPALFSGSGQCQNCSGGTRQLSTDGGQSHRC